MIVSSLFLPVTFSLLRSTVGLACSFVTPCLSPQSRFHLACCPFHSLAWRLPLDQLSPLFFLLSHWSSHLSTRVPLIWLLITPGHSVTERIHPPTPAQGEGLTWGGYLPFQTLPGGSKFLSIWQEPVLYLFGLVTDRMGSLGELEKR